MARSTLTTAARNRGEGILEHCGALGTEGREERAALAATAITELLHALGPADAALSLRVALDSYLSTLRSGHALGCNSTRDTIERARAALASGGA